MVWGFRVGSGLRVQRFRTQGLKVWLGSGSRFRFQLGSWYSRVWGFRIFPWLGSFSIREARLKVSVSPHQVPCKHMTHVPVSHILQKYTT